MAILDNAVWLTSPTGTAESGTTTVSDGAFSTTVTGTFTADAWDASQGGNNISEFGAFGVTSPITANYLFSSPVENLSFDINHVDDSTPTYDDYWTISARDENGNPIPAATIIAGLSGIQDELIITNPDGSVSINADGGIVNDITVTLAGPVSQLVLVMEPGPEGTATGGTGISDISFDIPDPNDNVFTGSGADDLIQVGDTDFDGTEIDGNDALGTHGEDVGSNADSISAGAGNDTVNAGTGADTISGGTGADSIFGEDGSDWITGGTGNDVLHGNDGLGGGENPNLIANGSFEGVTPTTFGQLDTLNEWYSWNGGSPDLNEEGGYESGYSAPASPTDGANYGSLVYGSNGFKEGASQDLATPLLSGTEYTLTLNAAAGQYQGSTYSDPAGGSVELEIWGNPVAGQLGADGMSMPTGVVLLGTATVTTTINSGNTQEVSITFTPTSDIATISISAFDAEVSGIGSFATITFDEVAIHESGDLDNDTLYGGIGEDTILADGGNDYVSGGDDNDYIDGGSGDDSLYGDAGDDSILGGAGNDSIESWIGNDTLIGGDGDDYLDGAQDSDRLEGGAGNDTLLGGSTTGEDTLIGGDGDDYLSSGGDADLLYGDAGEDTIYAAGGDDVAFGGDDDDLIYGLDGNDTLDGGAGNDYISGGAGADSLTGGTGGDDFNGGDGNDTILGGDDNDNIEGDAGNDSLDGGNGADSIWGGSGDDTILAGTGNDALYAGTGNDSVDAGAGTDYIQLTSGNDTVSAGDDADNIDLYAGAYVDGAIVTVDGGAGGTDSDHLDMSSWAAYRNLSETTDADGNSTSGTVELQDASGNWITVNFAEIEIMTLPALDLTQNYTVEGTAGADDIGLSYVGDPQGDMIDNNDHSDGSNDDSVEAGAGNDTVRSGAGNDTVVAGDGDDVVFGLDGDDILLGGDGNDSLDGDTGSDSIEGGAGSDTLIGDAGDDTLSGGADNDEIYVSTGSNVISGDGGDDLVFAGGGDDSIDGGSDADTLFGGDGADTIDGGTGDDSLVGSDGDDTFVLNEGFGNDTIIGDEVNETNGDTLDLSNLTTGVTVDLTDANAETGTVSDGTDTANFVEIENIVLGAGRDTVVLADGSGADTVQAFDMTDSGDGTTMDQLDVSALTTASGDPVTTDDVVITDTNGDGSGSAILTFPNGESITLIGVGASQVDTSAELMSIGIPATLNYIVEGTNAGEVINPGYINDPQDDKVDSNDAADGSNDDSIIAGGGNDTVGAGFGDDTVDAGDGDDEVYGETGNDSLIGGQGADTMLGEAGNDTLIGGIGADSLDGGVGADSLEGGAGADTLWGQDGNDTLDGGDDNDFVNGGEGNDLISGGDGDDTLEGWYGDDTILGGAGNDYIDADNDSDYVDAGSGDDTVVGGFSVSSDTIIGGAGNDSLDGQAGDDLIYGGTGADEQFGAQGDDTFFMEDDFGADTIEGGELDETNGDTLDLSAVTQNTTVDLRSADPEAGTVSNGTDTASFTEIENIVLGAGRDSLQLGDGSGADTVQAFDMTDSGDGTTMDQLDVSGLTDAGGAAVNVDDVVVSDTNGDGTGDAILTFPNGESITLVGVDPAQVATPAQLASVGIPAADFVVSGTAAGELIDAAYLGDPEGDLVDNNDFSDGSNVDVIEAGAGNDTVYAGAANDTVRGEDGDDSLFGETGDDTLYGDDGADTLSGDAGDDMLFGGTGADSLLGGDGNDTLNDGAGADYAEGGADADTFITQDGSGDDTIVGGETGTDDDTLRSLKTGDVTLDLTAGGTAADPESGTLVMGADTVTFSEIETVELGAGNDSVIGSTGDDIVETGAGSDTVEGGAGNDSFDIGALDGVSDTVVLGDGDGDDTVTSFELPTDNGDGTFTGNDLLDVSGLTDAGGDPVNTGDVTVGDDGSGNAVIGFPNGESITLVGVAPGDLSDPLVLQAMGIPGTTPNFVVDGTAAGDLIIDSYADDPEGDMIDNNDAADGSNDDVVYGYGGDDVIQAGDGNDTLVGGVGDDQLYGEDGNDSLEGGADNDQLYGGLGDDTMLGGAGDDSLFGATGADSIDAGAGDDTIRFSDDDTVLGGDGDDLFSADALVLDGSPISVTGGENAETGGDTLYSGSYNNDVTVDLTAGGTGADPESGTMQLGATTVTFSEVENIQTGAGDDTITGSSGDDNVTTGAGADVVNAGDGDDLVTGDAGADTLTGGAGADTLYGGDDDDVLNVGSGDSAFGDDGDDVFNLTPGDLDGSNLTITGGEGGETVGDTLNITGPASIVYDDPSQESGTITYVDTGEVVTFSEIENINYIPCFTPGTLIKTAQGEMPVEEITVGTRVLTNDHGYQPVVWTGAREIDAETLAKNYALKPVLIRKGALGKNMPERDMMVSPQHRMLIGNVQTALWLGEEEVLVPAKFLVGMEGIEEVEDGGVTYIHFMFDEHQVVMSDGCWSESFQPGDISLGAITEEAREEILTLFPELADRKATAAYPAARPTVDAKQARVLFH